jgi:hypothetical protein
MIDVRLIEALYESASLGRPVKVDLPYRTRRPNESQSIEKPAAHHETNLVHAEPPTRD